MSDQTAAANLEITSALAEAAEEILHDFAENAELEVALVVDHSGALIAGISADDEVNVETVGALVAGTIGSIRALGKSVGESDALESMHHGEETTIYLRELNERFIVVGVAKSGLPAGIIREVGTRISKPLLAVLLGEEIVESSDAERVDFNDENEIEPESLTEVGDDGQIELNDTSDSHPDIPEDEEQNLSADDEEPNSSEEEKPSIPPLVVDSPFEFVDDEEDVEDEVAAEEEEEGIVAEGEFFEIGVDDHSDSLEVGDSGTDEGGDSDRDDHETGVAAPLLVSPMMPTPEQLKIEIEEDATTSVAAISVPIATDIAPKETVTTSVQEDEAPTVSESTDSDDVAEAPEDEDEPVGGPRYVFEIG